jgi:polyhydroxyalkanoate synthase
MRRLRERRQEEAETLMARRESATAEANGARKRDSVGPRAAARSALDVMLTDAAIDDGGVRRFIKPTAAAKVAAALLRRPARLANRVGGLGQELGRIAAGRSEQAPAKSDRRFADPAWGENWLLRRLLQSYLATAETLDQLISDAELDWRTERQARFAAGNVLDAIAPTNFPWSNPAVLREIVDKGGAALPERHVPGAAPARQRRHEQVRGRRQPRAVAGIRGVADGGL